MAMYTVKNKTRDMVVVNVKNESGKWVGLYIPKRGRIALTEDQWNSPDVQAKVRQGVLKLEQTA